MAEVTSTPSRYIKRKKPLRRTDGFRRSPELAREFSLQVVGRSTRCIMAGRSRVSCAGPWDPCHIIPKRALRDRGFSEAIVYDARNGVCACRRHHGRNDEGLETFPRQLLPSSVLEFAEEVGLMWIVERDHKNDERG